MKKSAAIPSALSFAAFTVIGLLGLTASADYDSYGNACDNSSYNNCYDSRSGQYYTEGQAPPCPLPKVNMLTPADGQAVAGTIQLSLEGEVSSFTGVLLDSHNGYRTIIPSNAFQYSNGRFYYTLDTTQIPNTGDLLIEADGRNYCGTAAQGHQVVVQNAVAPTAPPPSAPQTDPRLTDGAVFDPNWYLNHNPDLLAAFGAGNTAAATSHWVNSGINEGRQAAPAFASRQYLAMYADLVNAFGGGNYQAALLHFVNSGRNEGRAGVFAIRGEVFDVNWYLNKYPDLKAYYGGDLWGATQHWLNNGLTEGRQGSPLFQASQYLSMYGDLQGAFGGDLNAALQHYISNGIREGRAGVYATRAEVFDVTYYLATNSDLAAYYGSNTGAATLHWLNNGIYEGRRGSAGFSSMVYLQRYSDLSAYYGSTNYPKAVEHYILHGISEGRSGQ